MLKRFSTLAVALVLFGLAGSADGGGPRAFAGPAAWVRGLPSHRVTAIVLTAGLFGYIYRLGMGFGRTVLVLAAGYNALIAAVKLGLAPAALYQANREQAFDAAFGDPNDLWFYLGVGSASSCSTCSSSGDVRRLQRRFGPRSRPNLRRNRVADGRTGLLSSALSSSSLSPPASSGSCPWSTSGFRPSPTSSISSPRSVPRLRWPWSWPPSWPTRASTRSRSGPSVWDATLLASFFWLGLALILLYHVMWVVFLLTLVSICPSEPIRPNKHEDACPLLEPAALSRGRDDRPLHAARGRVAQGLTSIDAPVLLMILALTSSYVSATSVNDIRQGDRRDKPSRRQRKALVTGAAGPRTCGYFSGCRASLQWHSGSPPVLAPPALCCCPS